MRNRIVLVLVAASLVACKRRPAQASTFETPSAEQTTAAAVAPSMSAAAAGSSASDAVRGRLQEKIDVNEYTYLRIATPSGDEWAAVPKTAVAVGDTVAVVGAMWMENFKSDTLGRTWPRIAFGTLQGEAAQGAKSPGAAMSGKAGPPGATPALPPGHPPRTASADVGEIKLAKASGAQGRTIADIYAQRAQLKERSVAVRGKVVKATNGVLGKNWLHLRDGSGQDATADLAVASEQTAAVGATVMVTGTVRLDRDLGSGYHYDVIVEDAKLQVE
jgi:hypothetical protein